FKRHINRDNHLGAKGELADKFATLIRVMWNDDDHDNLPLNIASELAWEKHLMRNSSIVVSLFQGQFCNRLFVEKHPHLLTILDGNDTWNCPRCNCPRRTTKQLSISRLPDILLIHLKRFSFYGPFKDKRYIFELDA
ncbi:18477_t:CDS:2, partial [Gigaspora margarita]